MEPKEGMWKGKEEGVGDGAEGWDVEGREEGMGDGAEGDGTWKGREEGVGVEG